jgi:hypothetical protein
VADFFHDVPDDVRAAAFAAPEPAQSDTPFERPWPLSSWPDIPTHVIQRSWKGKGDRLFPLEFQRALVRERLGLDLDVLPGGHLIALSRPHELTAQLLSYRI